MIEPDKAEYLFTCEVLDTYGETVGPVGQVWSTGGTGQPVWATVRTGTLVPGEHALPLHTAELHDEWIYVPYSRELITQAPDVDLARGAMTDAEEAALALHYDLPTRDDSPSHGDDTTGYGDSATPAGDDQTSPPYSEIGDNFATSTEQPVLNTEPGRAGRVRLVKYVVTELQQVTIEVSHEEVRLEREPLTGGEPATSSDGLMLEHDIDAEVTLYAERPVIQMEVVPIEQVRIAKITSIDEQTVTGLLPPERIDREDDEDTYKQGL